MSNSTYDPRITAYFGDAVMRAGFMPLPHLFLRHYHTLGLGHGEAMFVLQLMEINWDLGAPPKSVNDLARRMGVNARTVRRYSEVVAELGLIVLYDQYDDTGAQIENGYDLSPLFERLAAFAPEPPLGGQIRRRERRPAADDTGPQAGTGQATQRARRPAAGKTVTPPPDISVTPSYDGNVTRPPGKAVQGSPDSVIKGALIDPSGLKTEQRIHQESKNMMHDAAVLGSAHPPGNQGYASGGRSLRLGQPLSAADVASTDDILRRIGIDLPVRSRIRASLAPAEAWTLWAYAFAKRWSIPLLISEVYDKVLKQARPADVPQHFDEVGRVLAQLDPDRGEQLLRVVNTHWPDAPGEQFAECLGTPPTPEMVVALETVWRMFADLRNPPGKPSPLPTRPAAQAASPAPYATTWSSVLDRLATQIAPQEFTTWLQETTLVELETTSAFVGTSNIFARERVEALYLPAIEQTLSAVLGRQVNVQVVLGTGGA